MRIDHETAGDGGTFFIDAEGRRLAELTYVLSGADRMTINHTGVRDELRGKGAGAQLVEAAVQWARAEQKKVVLRCLALMLPKRSRVAGRSGVNAS
jgi:predicted GNAT family acetyltransferase